MPTLECSQHRRLLLLFWSRRFWRLMMPPIYARVKLMCTHLRMPSLECSQHRRCKVEIHIGSGMASFTHSGVNHMVFYLLGIPGREDLHVWISIPLFISYVFALLGNGFLIFIILMKSTLHEPMYLFLCMLAGVDIVFATTTEPKALAIFWYNKREISLNSCIAQLYFQHSSFISESGILSVMAFDRYIAICYPLRNNILPHTFCEHIGLAKYACDDIRVNIWYGFFVLMSTVILDIILIFISYVVILHAVFRIPSQDARHKALNTCGSHVCVIILFYGPGIFSVLTHRFGRHIPLYIHILLANVSMLAPPMLNPIIYGVKTKQIRDQVIYGFFSKQK
ncbi:Olfactory receptor 52B4 [Galemys pyrenaicus]|uniref:Olfactory receptor 52B4 n=1 Tax=Galemys pyrenaicus TaxID=202257 RepID=A0A8J6DW20_GALPY|nr:Olfactory receptor 52B4 [Galemys pyrenaicus]